MEQVICKKCTSLDCRGCNLLRLEQMLKSGKLNALMDEKHGIKTEIDVRPVVRGRNICDTVNSHCEFKCSVCGVELSSVYGGDNDFGLDGGYFNFCPNCGARMVTDDD